MNFHRHIIPGLVLAAALLFGHAAYAQTEPAVTFGASVTNANGSLSTRLTWSTAPAAQSCVAAGHASWSGSKPASGSADLPALTLSGTYTLTLECTWPGDTTARLTWVAPTQNTDGTALAKCADQTTTGPCLRSFVIQHGASASALTQTIAVNDRNATSYTVTGLAAGQRHFVVRAVNGNGVESDPSNSAMKTIVATQSRDAAVTLTVNPLPAAPSALNVE